MPKSFKGSIFLEDPPFSDFMNPSLGELSVEDIAERAKRPKNYRLLGWFRSVEGIDAKAEWASFCSHVGLRLNPKNNLGKDDIPEDMKPIPCFDQWLVKAGVEWINPPLSPSEAARLPGIFIDYID